jgi:hypothetical protein
MDKTILKNVSPSHRMVTHHLGTTFGEKKLGSRAFSLVIYGKNAVIQLKVVKS